MSTAADRASRPHRPISGRRPPRRLRGRPRAHPGRVPEGDRGRRRRPGVRCTAHRRRPSRLRPRPPGQPHLQRPRRRLRPGARRSRRPGLRLLEEPRGRRTRTRTSRRTRRTASAPPCSPWSGCSSSSPTPARPVELAIETKHPTRWAGPGRGAAAGAAGRFGLTGLAAESPVRVMSFSARSLHRVRAAAPTLPTVYLMQFALAAAARRTAARGRRGSPVPACGSCAATPATSSVPHRVGPPGARVDRERARGRRALRRLGVDADHHQPPATGAVPTPLRTRLIALRRVRCDTVAALRRHPREPNSPSSKRLTGSAPARSVRIRSLRDASSSAAWPVSGQSFAGHPSWRGAKEVSGVALVVAQEVPTSSSMAVPHGPAGVGEARRRMRADLLASGATETVVDDAVLILSELLSNACRHGRPLSHDEPSATATSGAAGAGRRADHCRGDGRRRPHPAASGHSLGHRARRPRAEHHQRSRPGLGRAGRVLRNHRRIAAVGE